MWYQQSPMTGQLTQEDARDIKPVSPDLWGCQLLQSSQWAELSWPVSFPRATDAQGGLVLAESVPSLTQDHHPPDTLVHPTWPGPGPSRDHGKL